MADEKISALTELTAPPAPTDEFVVVDKSDTTMAASGTNKRIQFSNLYDWAEAGDLSVIEPDDAAAAGSSTEIARADHQHAVAAGVPTSITTWTAGEVEGSAASFARSDHTHGIPWAGTITALDSVPLAQFAASVVSTATGVANTYYALPVLVPGPVTFTGVEFRNGATTNGNVRSALYNAAGTKVADRTSDLAQAGTTNANRKVPFNATYDATPGLYYALIWFSSATATAFMGYVLGTTATTGTNATTTPTTVDAPAVAVTAPVLAPY